MPESIIYHPLVCSAREVLAIQDGRQTQLTRPVNRRTCDTMPTWLWNRLEWDASKVPEGAPRTFADNGYLHVACRPHPEDPQTTDCWTRERVYPKWEVGDRLRVPREAARLILEIVRIRVERVRGGAIPWVWVIEFRRLTDV